MGPLTPFVIRGLVEGLSWAGGTQLIQQYVTPYFANDADDIAYGEIAGSESTTLNNDLLEDMVKTQKALLQYHEVREDIYTPLNIDSQ